MARNKQGIPSPSDACFGACLAIKNAKNLVLGAKALGQQALYGPAMALLVIAVEESVKSTVLARHYLSDMVPKLAVSLNTSEQVKKVLSKDHSPRHLKAALQYLGSQGVKEPGPYLAVLLSDPGNRDLFRDLFIGDNFESQREALTTLLLKSSTAENVIKWLFSANRRKQAGMYVDYKDAAWSTPSTISEADYEEAISIVEAFVDEAWTNRGQWLCAIIYDIPAIGGGL